MEKCTKKKFSKFEAMLVLAQSEMKYKMRKGRSKRRECRYYFCKECNAYHLTSTEDRKGKKYEKFKRDRKNRENFK